MKNLKHESKEKHYQGAITGGGMGQYNHSMSTNSEDLKDVEEELTFEGGDETESLTANDFELLNSENFFDKVQEAFANIKIPGLK